MKNKPCLPPTPSQPHTHTFAHSHSRCAPRTHQVTLWDTFVSDPGDALEAAVKSGLRPIVALKSVRVGDFNGKNLSTLGSSRVVVDPPNQPEAQYLRDWYNNGGAASAVAPLSERGGGGGGRQDRRVAFVQIREEGIGAHGAPEWVTVSVHCGGGGGRDVDACTGAGDLNKWVRGIMLC